MILFYLLATVLGLAVYAATFRLGGRLRATMALGVFVILAGGVTAAVIVIGDPPPPGSVVVSRAQDE